MHHLCQTINTIVPSTAGFSIYSKRQFKTKQQRFQKIILIFVSREYIFTHYLALPNGHVWFRRNYYVHAQGNQSA